MAREQLTDEQWEEVMAVCREHCPQMRNGRYEPRCIGCPVEATCQRVVDMDTPDWTQMYAAVKDLKEGNG